MKKKEKKYALVLSGGGFLGAFQLGALNYLNANWEKITGKSDAMKFDLIAGVSVGSINGAMVAMNKLDQLNELWVERIGRKGASEIYTSDFIDTNHTGDELKMKLNLEKLKDRLVPDFKIELPIFKKLGLMFSKKKRKKIIADVLKDLGSQLKEGFKTFKSLADNTPLKEKLTKYLDKDRMDGTEFVCGYVSLDTGAYHSAVHSSFENNESFIDAVVASSCIPIVFDPIGSIDYQSSNGRIRTLNNIDGGVNNVSPLGDVVKRIANDPDSEYKIIVINCHSGVNLAKDFTNKNIAQIAARSLYEIAFTEIFNNDVKHFLKINDLVQQAKAWDSEVVLFDEGTRAIQSFDSIVIQPHPEMDLGNGLVANEKLIQLRLEHGRAMAKQILKLND